MYAILLTKSKTDADKTMKKLQASGKILSYEPADILTNTSDEKGSVFPAKRTNRHLVYIDCLIVDGRIVDNQFRKFRDAFLDAMINNLKEFAFKIEMPNEETKEKENA